VRAACHRLSHAQEFVERDGAFRDGPDVPERLTAAIARMIEVAHVRDDIVELDQFYEEGAPRPMGALTRGIARSA